MQESKHSQVFAAPLDFLNEGPSCENICKFYYPLKKSLCLFFLFSTSHFFSRFLSQILCTNRSPGNKKQRIKNKIRKRQSSCVDIRTASLRIRSRARKQKIFLYISFVFCLCELKIGLCYPPRDIINTGSIASLPHQK